MKKLLLYNFLLFIFFSCKKEKDIFYNLNHPMSIIKDSIQYDTILSPIYNSGTTYTYDYCFYRREKSNSCMKYKIKQIFNDSTKTMSYDFVLVNKEDNSDDIITGINLYVFGAGSIKQGDILKRNIGYYFTEDVDSILYHPFVETTTLDLKTDEIWIHPNRVGPFVINQLFCFPQKLSQNSKVLKSTLFVYEQTAKELGYSTDITLYQTIETKAEHQKLSTTFGDIDVYVSEGISRIEDSEEKYISKHYFSTKIGLVKSELFFPNGDVLVYDLKKIEQINRLFR